MNWLATPSRIRQPDRIRVVFLLIAVIAFGITEFGRFVYRPWAYSHGLNDLGLADSIGNLGVVVQVFLTAAVINPTRVQSFRLAAFLAVGYVVYEFLQPYLPKGVFDWKDVAGTVIGYIVSITILSFLWRKRSP